MSDNKKNGTTKEVWALIGLVDGTNIVGKLKGADSFQDIFGLQDGWIELEEACTYVVQMAQVQGGAQALFSMCIPYAASPDSNVNVIIRLSNIASYCPFDKMPAKMQSMMISKVKESKATANKLAAANAGILTR